MFDISFSELAVTAILAVLLISPNDLPIISVYFSRMSRKLSLLKQEAEKLVNEFGHESGLSKDKYEEIKELYIQHKKQGYFLDDQGNIKKFYDITNSRSETDTKPSSESLFIENDENKTLH